MSRKDFRSKTSPLSPPRRTIFTLVLSSVFALGLAQDSEQLFRFADQIFTEVSNLRGLEIHAPVQKGVKSAAEIRESLRLQIEKEYGAERIENDRRLLVRLGVIPADYEYLSEVLDLFDEQVAGYYDPKSKTLFIASWLTAQQQKEALIHELAHALQDQHFELQAFLEEVDDDDDAALARKAVVEGEAVALTLDHSLQPFRRNFLNLPNLKESLAKIMRQNSENSTKLKATPEFLREVFVFPYLHGVRFLQVYRRWHPWEDMVKIYADPPKSTEQILHPEKYAGRRDDPTPVDRLQMPASLPPGWAIEYTNVLGEFSIYLWLKQFINEPLARQASRGWDGDAVQLLRHPGGGWGFAFRSVWDDAAHAQQFFEAVGQMVGAKHPASESTEESVVRNTWKTADLEIQVDLNGDQVEYFELDRVASNSEFLLQRAP